MGKGLHNESLMGRFRLFELSTCDPMGGVKRRQLTSQCDQLRSVGFRLLILRMRLRILFQELLQLSDLLLGLH